MDDNSHASSAQLQSGKVTKVTNYQRRPIIDGVLDFTDKLHKAVYEDGCKAAYKEYDIDDQGRHAFTTALRFKAKSFEWGGNGLGILDIPTGEMDDNGLPLTKYLLEHDGEIPLSKGGVRIKSMSTKIQCTFNPMMVVF